jgi:hypothetical protein
MSYWVTQMRCKKCGTEINVPGGVVGTQQMGPTDGELRCLNDRCDGQGYVNFERSKPLMDVFGVLSDEQRTEFLYQWDKVVRHGPRSELVLDHDFDVSALMKRVSQLKRFRSMAIKAHPELATIPLEPLPLSPEEIAHGKNVAEKINVD